MKKFLTLAAIVASLSSFAQFKGIYVEEVDNQGIVPGKTYRVYVEVTSTMDYLTAIYGFKDNKLSIKSTKPFFQSAYGGAMANSVVRRTLNEKPELKFDSWVTIGYADNYQNAVNSFLISFDDFEAGGSLETTDGAWYVTPDQRQSKATESKRILIAQFTTEGVVTGTINVQGRTVTKQAVGDQKAEWETWEVKDVTFTCGK